MIVNIQIRRVENGYHLRYDREGRSFERVFLDWPSLCDWLKEQSS